MPAGEADVHGKIGNGVQNLPPIRGNDDPLGHPELAGAPGHVTDEGLPAEETKRLSGKAG
jgi:hypothetical protein